MLKNPHTPNLTWIGSWWLETWPIANLPHWNQCKLAWFVNCLEPSRFTLISMGLIRYSCGHNYRAPWTDLGCHVFHHAALICGIQNVEMQKCFCDVITLVLLVNKKPYPLFKLSQWHDFKCIYSDKQTGLLGIYFPHWNITKYLIFFSSSTIRHKKYTSRFLLAGCMGHIRINNLCDNATQSEEIIFISCE